MFSKTDEHAPVLREHLGDECLDAVRRRASGKLLEQARSDTLALVVVRNGKCSLGRGGVAQPNVVAHRDDALLATVAHHADQGTPFGPIRLDQGAGEPLAGDNEAVKAQEAASHRELGEERDESRNVTLDRRTEAKSGAISEDHIDGHVGILHQNAHAGSLVRPRHSRIRGCRGSRRGKAAEVDAVSSRRGVAMVARRRQSSARSDSTVSPSTCPVPEGSADLSSETNSRMSSGDTSRTQSP